jgi:Flp pilus assembly pilin Flp
MWNSIRRFLESEDGQDLIEYSLLIVFIAMATMAFVGLGRDPVATVWTGADSRITDASHAATGGVS